VSFCFYHVLSSAPAIQNILHSFPTRRSSDLELAGEIIRTRIGHLYSDFRVDLIGLNSAHRKNFRDTEPYEIRLRIAGKTNDPSLASLVGEEVEALYTNGPAGGGGARKNVVEVVGIISTFIEEQEVELNTLFKEWNSNETV